MRIDKQLKYIMVILLTAAVGFIIVLAFYPKPAGADSGAHTIGYEKYFGKASVMTVDIVADDSEWEDMLTNAREEKYIRCDVIINGERIKNVGIRTKGNSSLLQVADSGSKRFSFKIEFDHYIKGQTFHGLDKMVLNNTQADATYMKEFMSYEIFQSVNVAVPLHSYAQIKVNGINSGLYLAVEAMEDSYASRVFGPDHGQLYRPENIYLAGMGEDDGVSLITALGSGKGGSDLVYTDDQISSYSDIFDKAAFDAKNADFRRVITALKNLNAGTELEKYINVEDTLRYFAAQTFIINFDSYYGKLKHNYYLYEKNGQLTMLPWDLNLSFAGYEVTDAGAAINNPIDTPLSGADMKDRPMLSKLLEVPKYKELYHKYLNQIVTNFINSGTFSAEIKKTDELIRPYVEKDTTAFYTLEEYEAAVPELEKLGLLRAKSITGQLAGTIPSTTEGQSADSSALISPGDLNLSVMGSQGSNGAWGKGSINSNLGLGRGTVNGSLGLGRGTINYNRGLGSGGLTINPIPSGPVH